MACVVRWAFFFFFFFFFFQLKKFLLVGTLGCDVVVLKTVHGHSDTSIQRARVAAQREYGERSALRK
jgi:hypothetical protein